MVRGTVDRETSKSVYLPNLILENVTQLILDGQADGASADAAKLLQPRAIAVKNADNRFLSLVRLQGLTNQRRIALAISQTGVLDNADLIDTLGNPSTLGNQSDKVRFQRRRSFCSVANHRRNRRGKSRIGIWRLYQRLS